MTAGGFFGSVGTFVAAHPQAVFATACVVAVAVFLRCVWWCNQRDRAALVRQHQLETARLLRAQQLGGVAVDGVFVQVTSSPGTHADGAADPLRWFGLARDTYQPPAVPGVAQAPASHVCSVCEVSPMADVHQPRYVLLPCRHQWCGCGAAKPVTSPSLLPPALRPQPVDPTAAYAAAAHNTTVRMDATDDDDAVSRPAASHCIHCGSGVAAVIDVHQLFLDMDHPGGDGSLNGAAAKQVRTYVTSPLRRAEAVPGFPTSPAAAAAVEIQPEIDAPDCCVCLAAPSSVVALPCMHLATCCDCGHRIAAAAHRQASPPFADAVSCCPLCRTPIRAMAVLDDVLLSAAVHAAAKR
jgi:hypothetical protein